MVLLSCAVRCCAVLHNVAQVSTNYTLDLQYYYTPLSTAHCSARQTSGACLCALLLLAPTDCFLCRHRWTRPAAHPGLLGVYDSLAPLLSALHARLSGNPLRLACTTLHGTALR